MDITENWFDFGDIDLIFKVTAVENVDIQYCFFFSENTDTSYPLIK